MNATRDFDESLVMLAGARVISTAKDQFDRKPGIFFESHTFGPLLIDSDRGAIRI